MKIRGKGSLPEAGMEQPPGHEFDMVITEPS